MIAESDRRAVRYISLKRCIKRVSHFFSGYISRGIEAGFLLTEYGEIKVVSLRWDPLLSADSQPGIAFSVVLTCHAQECLRVARNTDEKESSTCLGAK